MGRFGTPPLYEHVMVETLSGKFNAILGGNVYIVMLHVNAATLRGLTFFVSYIMWFQKIIMYKIPPGGGRGVYSQLKAYTNLMLHIAGVMFIFYQLNPAIVCFWKQSDSTKFENSSKCV